MKKTLILTLVGMMTAAVVLGGCGKKGAAKDGSSAGPEDVQIAAEELLKATEYDVKDYVTLNDYGNMKITLPKSSEVSEENIASYANMNLSAFPAYEASDKKTVEKGDIVNIDYVGKKDGKEFGGGTAEGYHLEIGSGSFIDGFEDGLIGKKVGETVELNLTFPENYDSTDLAGQAVVFTVTINSIDVEKEMTYDALTDEYVSENFGTSGITTVDAFKEQVKAMLEQNYQSALQSAILDKLVEECRVEIPKGLIDQRMTEYISKIKAQIESQAAAVTDDSSAQPEEQAATFEDVMGMTEEEYRQQIREDLEKEVTQELILEAIVQKEDISISQNEYDAFIQRYISSYGFADEAAFYEQYGEKNYVQLSYAENEALELVRNGAKVTFEDTAADGEDTSGQQ